MNALLRPEVANIVLGTAMLGGYYAGAYQIDGKAYGLIVAPKLLGELAPMAWHKNLKAVPGALSYVDGRGNTAAMAAAGSPLAKKVLEVTIGEYSDWYLGAQDEVELCYRAFKPTTTSNWLYARSGVNASALPPTYPYAAELPVQTSAEIFRDGGAEAFEAEAYWTSTQHAGNSDCAWYQHFYNGGQNTCNEDNELRARLVRRFPL